MEQGGPAMPDGATSDGPAFTVRGLPEAARERLIAAHIGAALDLIGALPAGSVPPFGAAGTRVHGRLAPGVTTRKRTNDLTIVATALRHGARPVSADAGVGRIVEALDEGNTLDFLLLRRRADGRA